MVLYHQINGVLINITDHQMEKQLNSYYNKNK